MELGWVRSGQVSKGFAAILLLLQPVLATSGGGGALGS